jgi:UDP-glucose 4-epimerase
MAKSILLTGGLGYVGGRLSKYLSSMGHQVYALSRNKKAIQSNAITVLTNEEVLKNEVLDAGNIDVVIHLAATNEIVCGQNPKLSNEVNINGTVEWLEWARQKNVKHFIYFSTVHVYGSPLKGFYTEDSRCLPAHPYSITHKAAEDYVNWYNRDFNLKCSIVRLSNSFGYPAFNTADRWSLLVNDICKQIVGKRKIELRSNRFQQRDFIALFDVCTAVQSIVEQKRVNKSHSPLSPIYNLTNGSSKTLMEMALMVKTTAEEYLNEEVELIFDENKDAMEDSLIISNKNLTEIGWSVASSKEKDEIIGLLDFITKYSPK